MTSRRKRYGRWTVKQPMISYRVPADGWRRMEIPEAPKYRCDIYSDHTGPDIVRILAAINGMVFGLEMEVSDVATVEFCHDKMLEHINEHMADAKLPLLAENVSLDPILKALEALE